MSAEAIRTLVHRYADAVSRGDGEQLSRCWAEEAVWRLPPGRGADGREDILKLWRRTVSATDHVVQVVLNGEASGNDGLWRGRWYVMEFIDKPDTEVELLIAYYDDVYVHSTDTNWQFAERHMTWLYRGPAGLAKAFL